MKMKHGTLVAVLATSVLFGGCATITSSEMQSLTLNTKSIDGQTIESAKCTLTNDKGSWEVTSPGVANVRRSSDDLIVECQKEGVAQGFLRAISRAAGGMWGNIVFGGGIGALIDHSKGTGYNYPDHLPVRMGENVTVDRSQNASEGAVQQAAAAPQQ